MENYADPDDHDSIEDLLETAVFAAETAVTVDDHAFVLTMGGTVRDGYGGEARYSSIRGFEA